MRRLLPFRCKQVAAISLYAGCCHFVISRLLPFPCKQIAAIHSGSVLSSLLLSSSLPIPEHVAIKVRKVTALNVDLCGYGSWTSII